jgi:NAD(P)-dependent dehydrogenase (short-subunit alcohol dehydrogenase family)
MKKSKDLRIVNVSSTAHRRVVFDKNKVVDLDWNNLNFTSGYSSGLAYSRSKLANVLFTQ